MDEFFEIMTPQSEVKIDIVTKYFNAWSKIMLISLKSKQVGYVDLFSGPGHYRRGEDSTPLRILKRAVSDDLLRARLRTLFNDVRPDYVSELRNAINNIDGIESLSYAPKTLNKVVGTELIRSLREFEGIPTLYFVDPWGYKGITAELLRYTVSGKGSECILFFNFNRVNSAISNPVVRSHMEALFGKEDYSSLLQEVLVLDNSRAREERIVQALSNLLKDSGAEHQMFFRFEQEESERTSHYIVFASKHPLGSKIMKDIMARESIGPEGIALFEWKPQRTPQLMLDLGLKRSEVDQDIVRLLFQRYSMREATVGEIFAALSSGTTYTLADFQRVLNSLEADDRVQIDKPRSQRMRSGRVTLGENRRVRFLE